MKHPIRLGLKLRTLARDTRGANMVEYIILVGVVALLCMATFGKFKEAVVGKIQQQSTAVGTIGNQ